MHEFAPFQMAGALTNPSGLSLWGNGGIQVAVMPAFANE
jgi:hypothetical protein